MAYVVTDACTDCKYTDCVTQCPVSAFYEDERMVYIHPDVCICCGACAPVCPVNAIFDEGDLADEVRPWAGINAERTRGGDLLQITASRAPLPTAEEKRARLGV